MDRINKVVFVAAVTVLSFSFTSEIKAGAGIDESVIQELKNLIEQQQKQLDRQGAEIARLKEKLGGAAEGIAQKADETEQEDVNAKTWSVAAVQDIYSWGTEIYLAYRNYRLDRDEFSLDDVNAVLGGARVKF